MKDAMLSFRLPTSLIEELKELAEQNHYVDLSEQIRDIIRQKCANYLEQDQRQKHSSPAKYSQDTLSEDKKQIVHELQTIIEQLKKGI